MSKSLLLDGTKFRVANYGDEFLLLRPAASGTDLPKIGLTILNSQLSFIEEVIATEVEICLKINELFRKESLDELEQIRFETEEENAKFLSMPVYFSNELSDWKQVCDAAGLTRDKFITELDSIHFRVAMFGFLPGFLYLSGLPSQLHVPRKETPDKRTDSNAFAIGGKYAGIYSLPSPAGWHVVGKVAVRMIDGQRIPPLLINPGDLIRLQQIDQTEYQKLVDTKCSILQFNGLTDNR